MERSTARAPDTGTASWTSGLNPGTGRFVTPYEVDTEQARIVDEIFTAYVDEGRSPQEICDELNARNVAPPDGDRPHRAKRMPGTEPQWFQGSMRALLSNPLLGGVGALPPRTDQALWLLGHRRAEHRQQGCGQASGDRGLAHVRARLGAMHQRAGDRHARAVKGGAGRPATACEAPRGWSIERAAPDRFLLSDSLYM